MGDATVRGGNDKDTKTLLAMPDDGQETWVLMFT